MLSHISLKVNDIAKAKEFYTKALAPLGYKVNMDYPDYKMAGLSDAKGNTDFWLDGNGSKQATHVAFMAQSEEQVQEFYKGRSSTDYPKRRRSRPFADGWKRAIRMSMRLWRSVAHPAK